MKIPYYVWLGAQKDAMMPLFSLDAEAAMMKKDADSSDSESSDSREVEENVVAEVFDSKVVSADHVHGQGLKWRKPFDISLIPRFKTYIYAFAWEDPKTDLEYLDLTPEDHMMVITSGGCNALEYAVRVGPKR